MAANNALLVAAAAIVTGALWLYRINMLMKVVPTAIAEYSPHRWTKEEVKETYAQLSKEPLDFTKLLPPKLERRYVVVGGSGMLQLPSFLICTSFFSLPTR